MNNCLQTLRGILRKQIFKKTEVELEMESTKKEQVMYLIGKSDGEYNNIRFKVEPQKYKFFLIQRRNKSWIELR